MSEDTRIRTSLERLVASGTSDDERKDRLWRLFRETECVLIDLRKCDDLEAPFCRAVFERQMGIR